MKKISWEGCGFSVLRHRKAHGRRATPNFSPKGALRSRGRNLTSRRTTQSGLRDVSMNYPRLRRPTGSPFRQCAGSRKEETPVLTIVDKEAGLVWLGDDGSFLRWNDRFVSLLGYSFAELRWLKFWQIIHPQDAIRIKPIWEGYFQGKNEPAVSEVRLMCRAGREISLRIWTIRSETGHEEGVPHTLVFVISPSETCKMAAL
ncbi:MAG: PAS domain-containing protein [Candidatus Riflebacteria bacterium]|nr:PAS domain-containing protein [Candidatus Riflebacteria bacterium]